MFSLTKEERLVLISLGAVVALGLTTSYLLKTSSFARDLLNITSNYERHLRLDVNAASYEELLALPHVGPQLAHRIISYREQNGRFSSLEELKKVGGVGPFKFRTIERYLIATP